jgi:hypothetical protein
VIADFCGDFDLFELNIEEGGLKSLFEGRNEAQKLDLRLEMMSNEK